MPCRSTRASMASGPSPASRVSAGQADAADLALRWGRFGARGGVERRRFGTALHRGGAAGSRPSVGERGCPSAAWPCGATMFQRMRSSSLSFPVALRHAAPPDTRAAQAHRNRPRLRTTPAISPAASPDPAKRSPRAGPTIAEPVSWATISRRNGPPPNAVSAAPRRRTGCRRCGSAGRRRSPARRQRHLGRGDRAQRGVVDRRPRGRR